MYIERERGWNGRFDFSIKMLGFCVDFPLLPRLVPYWSLTFTPPSKGIANPATRIFLCVEGTNIYIYIYVESSME